MTTFREQVETDQAVFFNDGEFGLAALFLPAAGGPAIPVTVVLEIGDSLADDAFGRDQAAAGKIHLRKSEIASPAIDDTVTFDDSGESWRVVRVISSTEYASVLEVIRAERMSLK